MLGQPLIYRLNAALRRLYVAVSDLHWGVLLGIVLVHMAVSYGLLSLAGETDDLLGGVAYLYWYATTALTVGYGDLSPKTDGGRLAAAFFIMPGAIACFTAAIAKTLDGISEIWRQRRIGQGDYREMKNAIVIVGYDPDRTPRMIDEIVAAGNTGNIVMVATQQLDNIDPRYSYIHASSLTAKADLERAGVPKAGRVIVYTTDDGTSLGAALAVTALNDEGHVVAYFRDPSTASILRAHCPEVEIVMTPSVEMVVKALHDPGSSQLLAELVSHTDDGATLYSAHAAMDGSFDALTQKLRSHGAVLIAWCRANEASAHFDVDAQIAKGDKLFYISKTRLPEAWA